MPKKKKKAVVPRLRFPEFRDAGEWEVKRLGEITNRITGAVGEAALTPVSITANRGFVPQAQKFGRDISGRQYLRYIRLKNGWFAYNRGNSKSFPQGAIYQLIEFQEAAVPNVFYCFEFKSNFVPEFYKGYFQINYHGHQLSKFITSGARGNGLLNIRAEDFFSLELPSPNNRLEQQKIADCLASLDDLIRAREAQLVALKDHKKGLMQQLFPREGETTPRLRFPEFRDAGEWEVKRLGEVCEINPPSKVLLTKFIYIDLESIKDGRLTQKKIITKSSAPSRAQRLLEKGDIIYQMVRPYQKNNFLFYINDEILYVASTGYAQLRAHGSNTFLYQLVHTEPFTNSVLEKCTGSNYPAISSSDLSDVFTALPATLEQQKIADCLASLDDLIRAGEAQLVALKDHKKGLMQQLFPQEVA